MAKHCAALLLIASLVAVALSGADARPTVGPNKVVVAALRGTHGQGYVVKAAPPVPQLTCSKVHGVLAGETCSSVGQGAKLNQEQFLGFNPNINCEDLFVGQWVCLQATTA